MQFSNWKDHIIRRNRLLEEARSFHDDASRVLHLFEEIKGVTGGTAGMLIRTIPGMNFFRALVKHLRILERALEDMKKDFDQFPDKELNSLTEKDIADMISEPLRERIIKEYKFLKNIFSKVLDKQRFSDVFVVIKKKELVRLVSACEDLHSLISTLEKHFLANAFKICIDLTARTDRMISDIIHTHVIFPDINRNTLQYITAPGQQSNAKRLEKTRFITQLVFELQYRPFTVFDCNKGFILNFAHHTLWGAPPGKTLIVDASEDDMNSTISGKVLLDTLTTFYSSTGYSANGIHEALLTGKLKAHFKVPNHTLTIAQSDSHHMRNVYAVNSTGSKIPPPDLKGLTVPLRWKIQRERKSATWTSANFLIQFTQIEHVTPSA